MKSQRAEALVEASGNTPHTMSEIGAGLCNQVGRLMGAVYIESTFRGPLPGLAIKFRRDRSRPGPAHHCF